ncbi:ankyrin repeat-containing domain protein [Mycena vulgaris]|nr:ankyrin repeat-containing domain protein [Mycena vulgaris]
MKDLNDWKELTSNWIHHKGSPGDRTASKKAKSTTEFVVDNLSVAVDVAGKVAEILQVAPVIAPVGALLSQILDIYQDMKNTHEKRDALAATITALSGDICATVLRMEGTKCSDLMARLKADLEKYAALISRASELVDKYDKQGKILRFASRKPLAGEIDEIKEELAKLGARFRSNRLVDLAINLSSNADTLNQVYGVVNKEKLEKWLLSPPEMTRKHNNTEKRRKDGTGRWFLEGKEFIEWQDNPGVLWIEGHSGAGKSVLCSAVISKLDDDKSLVEELESPRPAPALAYFYFDFNNAETQDVEIALRRIILQLSDQCPHPYKSLDKHYAGRQTLPSYKDLQQKILPVLLQELGRTYIVLDGLDECDDYDRLVDLISTFRQWSKTPLHVFITSQSRRVFTESFDGVTRIALEYSVTEADIRFFVRDEIQSKRKYESWRLHVDRITDQIASRSNGMQVFFRFRLADCLLLEISRCMSTTELDEALKNLPDTLFKVYNRFLDKVSPTHLVYVMAALRWILFAAGQITLDQLADALSFDFSNPDEYSYDPERRERNKLAIFRWLEGLVVKSTTYDGIPMAVLAHSSVKEYALSDHFSTRFGCNLEKNHSYSFIARTCISYFLSVGDHSMPAEPASDPLAKYAAKHWIHHLVLCEDPAALFTQAARVLTEGSGPYKAFCSSRKRVIFPKRFIGSPLHICCQDGYIEGVEALLATGVDINLAPAKYPRATALTFASDSGHTDIVDLLLRNQADPNIPSYIYGCALGAASSNGHIEVVRLLVKSGANANLPGGKWGTPLAAASVGGHIEILRLLLESGADINQPIPGPYSQGSALGAACGTWSENPEVVHFLLDNGADINLPGGEYGSPLGSACSEGKIGIVRLLLQRGADVNILGGVVGCALGAACGGGHTEIVRLLLQNGADIDAAGGYAGSPLGCASFHGQTAVVRLLIDSGANVNIPGGSCGSPLGRACRDNKSDVARLLLDNGADINLPAGKYGSVLGAAASSTSGAIDGRLETLRLLLERGAGVQKQMDHALKLALNLDLKRYDKYGGNARLEQEGHRSQVVQFLRERGAVANSELEGETASEESDSESDGWI